ncbi:DUF1491 family protein [Sphingobium nicotianae]|uniref:DUF1491 family protein n=1 Tax=Sphingobium nicotianae TaxID=2782607 RepID=A0A9X1IST3_9SPHN|nr:DUF1491 family protein [Sphingobium nicotianae]MBT2188595.1 DUF1491 family protein [Sphingobium nicotianae]
MSGRLTSQMLVSALIRRAQAAGGFATVLHKGESMSGAIVVQVVESARHTGFFERIMGLDGRSHLVSTGPKLVSDFSDISQYIDRRLRADPDIWFVELDVAEGEQLAADILCAG